MLMTQKLFNFCDCEIEHTLAEILLKKKKDAAVSVDPQSF